MELHGGDVQHMKNIHGEVIKGKLDMKVGNEACIHIEKVGLDTLSDI